MTIRSIHETILYASDVPAAARFYRDVLGLREIGRSDALSVAFRMPEGDAVLLIFDPARSSLPDRGVPSHGAVGQGHVAFRIDAGSIEMWASRFAQLGVPIEMDLAWQRGGRSIYVRDPSGNSVEVVDGEIWPA